MEATTTGVELFADDKDIMPSASMANCATCARRSATATRSNPSRSIPKTPRHHAPLRHACHGPGGPGAVPEREAGRGPIIKDGFYYDFQVDEPSLRTT